MAIKESALAVITSITQSDFVRAVTSAGASRRITVANLAKAIIENYTGSSLVGKNQSVKAALDSLNSNMSGIVFFKTTATPEAKTFTLGSSYRGLLIVHDSTSHRNGMYMLFSTAAGAVDVKPISSANEITIDTSVNSKLSLTAQTGSRIVVFFTAQGNVSE